MGLSPVTNKLLSFDSLSGYEFGLSTAGSKLLENYWKEISTAKKFKFANAPGVFPRIASRETTVA